jgi:hypothetical protein
MISADFRSKLEVLDFLDWTDLDLFHRPVSVSEFRFGIILYWGVAHIVRAFGRKFVLQDRGG